MIAALYLRSATQNDDAIAEQHRSCAAHAAGRGWTVGEVFTDNGYNGLRDDRPGLGALRECLREGRASVVIAEDGVRFFRDLDKLADFAASCEAQGAKLSCVQGIGSMKNLMQRLIKEDIAERQRRTAGRTLA
ncbi:hypothetical protein JSE7799_01437 [Jannaschia seosinensis]|uniref:Resolvase/invertase-type recombinase catalytic domain-containing protein n=1 Tax=Jannaschia seosinensis TaxID=313367 RepID=A0A0M7B9H9_9RHOB|nr:recombinase family protein [Jannaschia seosinensis]CUH38610.1 hypothetical protein JSE7799_01437 [Jannaschia seosinensis]